MNLNQTWVLCLRMWRWIAKEWKPGDNVGVLKERWLRTNGYRNRNINSNCFFCEYAAGIKNDHWIRCYACPGRKYNRKFHCGNAKYYYLRSPKAFYKELLRLNRIRKQAKHKKGT